MVVERLDPTAPEFVDQSPDHLARYLFALQYTRERRVLDAGTGLGYGAALLKGDGATSVVAVDIEADVIRRARELFVVSGLDYRTADCEKLDELNAQFDVVVSFENIEHLREPRAFLDSAAKVMPESGVLLCSTPDRDTMPPFVNGKPSNPFHIMEWRRDEFVAMLSEYFHEVDCRCQVISHRIPRALRSINTLRSQLRSSPFFYIKRAVLAVLGRPWPDLGEIAIQLPQDYPIVPRPVAMLFGSLHGHVAICRRPKRRG